MKVSTTLAKSIDPLLDVDNTSDQSEIVVDGDDNGWIPSPGDSWFLVSSPHWKCTYDTRTVRYGTVCVRHDTATGCPV